MSIPVRSQHRPPMYHQDRSTADTNRHAPSRNPTEHSNNNVGQQGKRAQHIPKLARISSQRETLPDNAPAQRRGSTHAAQRPATAARQDAREALVSPHSQTSSAAQYQRRPSRIVTPQPPPTTRTPSLFSGSSVQTLDSPRSRGLRRKPSTIDSYTAQVRAHGLRIDADRATMHSRDEDYNEVYDDAVLGISLPPTGKNEYRDSYLRSAAPAGTGILPSLDTHHAYSNRDFTPPVPGLSHSATPSSRHTDSPYSHVPTPSSASSYSSGFVTTSAQDAKYSSNSPLRPRQMISAASSNTNDASSKALPPVRESSTSSSNSTVKAKQPQPGSKLPTNTISGAPSNAHTSTHGRRLSSTHRKSLNTAIPTQINANIPPELAHLNVDAPLQPNIHAHHPRRPSRDQTPSLNNLKDPSPVVHSDLPRLYTTYHKRTPSQDTIGSATSTSLRSRFGFSPRSSSKQASPRVDSAFSPSSTKKPTRLPTPDSARSDRPRLLRKDSPAVDQSVLPAPPSKSPRFSFMSRKSKSSSEKSVEKPKRDAVKGPVAGTGHEKYGRFAFRGRSNGNTNSFSRSSSASSSASGVMKSGTVRKSSTTSDDGSEMDEFLRDRLSPVVLRGGNGIPFGTRTEIWAEKGQDSSSSQSLESVPRPQLLPSAMARDDDVRSMRGTPDHGDPFGGKQAAMGIQPVARNHNDSALQSQEGKEGLWLRPLKQEKPVPRLKHKWNFFQRAQSSHNSGDLFTPAAGRTENDNAHANEYQDALHLGILDAVEPVNLAEVERIIQEHDKSDAATLNMSERLSRAMSSNESGPDNNRWSSLAKVTSRESDVSDARRLSPSVVANQILTESPELLKARTAVSQQPRQVIRTSPKPLTDFFAPSIHSPEVLQTLATPELMYDTNDTPETPQSAEHPRQPRLSPVGRIPTVVSKRDRDRRLPDNSFSRPFATTQPRPTARPPGSLYNQIRDLASPTDSGSQPVSSTSGRSDSISVTNQSSVNADQPSASTNRSSIEFYAGNDFIIFAPRKNSDISYTSSSGSSNWRSSVPARAPEEDIWSEYNDLMDDVMPDKTPISAGSSHGVPFQYANMLHDKRSPTMPAPLRVERSASLKTRAVFPVAPATCNQHQYPALENGENEFMLRPVSPLAPEDHEAVAVAASHRDDRFISQPVSPLTPDTLAHFVGTYGDRSTYSSDVQNRLSVPQHRSSMISPRGSTSSSRYSVPSVRHSRSASVPEVNFRHSQASIAPSARLNRDTQLLDIPEQETHKKFTTSDLRFGALMTSKWLTFGRILFSPAHHEVQLAGESRILVIDGLGDDWSHYVATSYPNAIVYNLGISTSKNSGSSGWGPLKNYRHFNHPSLSTPLPFPRGFFAAVVFRFPMAAREYEYQACILESKRVLRPGGHLEVVALDIDMMNMGTRGRRALRGLKTRIQQGDQDVSLGNLSDTLVRMIGRRGFEEVQRCVVGVPAAGRIPRSDDVRSSSCSSTSTGGIPHKINNISAAQRQDEDVSFANLLQKNRQSQIVEPGAANDEGITKMVARVGRWWYSTCYEQPLLETDKSVWQERGLLRECEKQGTSFRLLICCAQKPLQARRRTKSV